MEKEELKKENNVAENETVAEKAKEKKCPQGVLDIYERVHEEFKLASDKEYEILKKQLFKDKK